jgi:hypothetical protein
MLSEGPQEEGEDADMWLKMATCVRKVASKVFGMSRGDKREAKGIGDGMTRCKGLLGRRRSVSSASTVTRVQPTSRAIK